MKCPRCGGNNHDGARFCQYCGYQLPDPYSKQYKYAQIALLATGLISIVLITVFIVLLMKNGDLPGFNDGTTEEVTASTDGNTEEETELAADDTETAADDTEPAADDTEPLAEETEPAADGGSGDQESDGNREP